MPIRRGKRQPITEIIHDAGHCHSCERAAKHYAAAVDITPDYTAVLKFCSRRHRDLFLHYHGYHARRING